MRNLARFIDELENNSISDNKISIKSTSELTEKDLNDIKLLQEVHPDWYKPTKARITIMLDRDILDVLKSEGKGYQTRINTILREAVLGK